MDLSTLNEAQRAAVEHVEGPLMIVAGAGSGKTRVLTYRIARLIDMGVDPFNILALTFTNKAAKEMKERIASLIGNEARNLWMGTFHSVFARILRIEHEKIGFSSNFTIYDTQDSRNLIKTIIKEMQLDDKVYKPNLVQHRISVAKNNLISAAAYAQNPHIQADDRQSNKPLLAEIYKRYEQRCFKADAMDFDDLLFKTNILLRDNPDVLLKYQERFKFILVDEFQDTNPSQYLILKQLAARYENICVVGDDAQSIYAFRGANIENILNFKKDFPEAAEYKLERNYRSTKNIVNAANSIIKNNVEQIKKNVYTTNEEGEKIVVTRLLTDNEEGLHVARKVFDLINNHKADYKDFAVLYRTNSQSRAIEEALRKKNIPYKIYGGQSFYQRKEIKDLLAYFRLSVNHNDEEALKRIINYPARGIGNTSLQRLIVAAAENGLSVWQVVEKINTLNTGITSASRNRIADFASMIKNFKIIIENKNAYEAAEHILKHSGLYKELYNDKTPEGVSRYENVMELLNGIAEFTDNFKKEDGTTAKLADFLQDVALLTDQDTEKEEDRNKVTLMTIHASKGLEFPYVFIVGMEENLFPSQLSLGSRRELEEERRLFYVALTRAEKQVFLSFANNRYRYGQYMDCEPSRFLDEIDKQYLSFENIKQSPKAKQHAVSIPPKGVPRKLVKLSQADNSIVSEEITKLATGMKVEHARFGIGKVLSLEGNPPNQKATVFFQHAGQKQLLLKFAKLKILS
ncbi:MAG: ATP-dependent DNA helicase [Bacteroidetes bacterium]|nr:MAG: ATP-dependent DNA helicase [Bacteroidota bacterium]